MIVDKYQREINVGDFIVCTGGQGTLQEMEVLKLKENERNEAWSEVFCLNNSGYKKWKIAKETVIVTEIKGN